MITNRKFTKEQLKFLFAKIIDDSAFPSFTLTNLKSFFGAAKFTGKQKLSRRKDVVLDSIGKKGEERKISKA